MAKAPAAQLICSVCKVVCKLPADVENLPTNLHALHILKLNKIIEEKIDQTSTVQQSGSWNRRRETNVQDQIVRLWPLSKAVEDGRNVSIVPIEMEDMHESRVCCLALSSDNERLFSGDSLGQVFIHDVAMWVKLVQFKLFTRTEMLYN